MTTLVANEPDGAEAEEPPPPHRERSSASRSPALNLPTISLAQLVRAVAGLLLAAWSLTWYQNNLDESVAPLLGALTLILGLAIIALAVAVTDPVRAARLDIAILTTTVAATFVVTIVVGGSQTYGTDELVISQTSSDLVLHGDNPYLHDFAPDAARYGMRPTVATPLLSGGTVHTATYPALSFLAYVPFGLLFGEQGPYGLVVDALAWVVAMILLWRLLPASLRPVVPLLVASTTFASLVAEGVTDFLHLPLLLAALWRWDRYGAAGERSPARWLGPVALGLASAVKQTPWLVIPFLLVGVALSARADGRPMRRTVIRYGVVAAAAFLVPNVPFIVASPQAWFEAVFLPFLQPLLPFGSGVVAIALYTFRGSGAMALCTVAGAAAMLTSIALFGISFRRVAPMLPLFALVPPAFANRSLFNYFVFALPLVMVSVTSVRVPVGRLTPRARRAAGVVAATGGLTVAGLYGTAFATPPPLAISNVTSATPAADQPSVVTFDVTNRSASTVHPHFLVLLGGSAIADWMTAGADDLAPGATAHVALVGATPRIRLPTGATIAVAGLVQSPASVTVSATGKVT